MAGGLATDARWDLIAESAGAVPVFIVSIGGRKFCMAARNVFDYPSSVVRISPRSASLDMGSLEQTISAVTIEFIDDGGVRDLIVSGATGPGKDVVITQGWDVSLVAAGTDFPEAAYAPYCTALFDTFKEENGLLVLQLRDVRAFYWDRPGATKVLPVLGDGEMTAEGIMEGYLAMGPVCEVLEKLIDAADVPNSKVNAATFDPAALPLSGHLVVDRGVSPPLVVFEPNAGDPGHLEYPDELEEDRRVREVTPIATLIREIVRVARVLLLIHEDGLFTLKENDLAEAAVDTFTEDDIVRGTFRSWISNEDIATGVVVKTGFDNLTDGKYRVNFRDRDNGAEIDWAFEGGVGRETDLILEDRWFSTPVIRDPYAANIRVGDTTIEGITPENFMFTGTATPTSTPPLSVSAGRPAYFWIWGPDPAKSGYEDQPGEFIKVTSVTKNAAGYWTIGGITRAFGGSTARQHGNKDMSGQVVKYTSDVKIWDVTACIRGADNMLRSHGEGAPNCAFSTPWNLRYKVRVGEVVNLVYPSFLAKSQDGLAAGNAVAFRCTKKEADPETMLVDWEFKRVNNKARNSLVDKGAGFFGNIPNANLPGRNVDIVAGMNETFSGGAAGNTNGGLNPAFLRGGLTTSTASLTITIDRATAVTPFGTKQLPAVTMAFTANRDCYIDFVARPLGRSVYRRMEVPIGELPPPLYCDGAMRVWKVQTNGVGVVSSEFLGEREMVGSTNLRTKSVITRTVADRAVTREKVEDRSIDANKLENEAVANAAIRPSAVTPDKLSQTLADMLLGTGGNDGELDFDGTKTVLGMVPAASVYTLTREFSASRMFVRNGVTIRPAGYRIFARELHLFGSAIIHRDGVDGGMAPGGRPAGIKGIGGPTAPQNMLGSASSGNDGGVGGLAGSGGATAGGNGTNLGNYSLGGNGGAGGKGGDAGGPGGLGGNGGTVTVADMTIYSLDNIVRLLRSAEGSFSTIGGGAGGGGGGGGGATAGVDGGGGGASGSGAGVLLVSADVVYLWSWTGRISANGGRGGSAATTAASGGGSGGGGGGGLCVVIYRKLIGGQLIGSPVARGGTATVLNSNVQANGGSPGAPGGLGGVSGATGQGGTAVVLDLMRTYLPASELASAAIPPLDPADSIFEDEYPYDEDNFYWKRSTP